MKVNALRELIQRIDGERELTVRPVALEDEGSNCFSITQLVGKKRQ